ncbi:unnamed protein product, partial [Polarella glacialis]
AASSVQRLAGQAELSQLGEQFLASAEQARQNIAEQGEAAWTNVADKVVGSVSSLGLAGEFEELAAGRVSSEELAQRFVRETRHLEPPTGAGRLPVADVLEVLRIWEGRLQASATGTGARPGSRTDPALQGLLKSRTLQVAFSALTRSRAGRAVLRAAAGSSDGLGLSDRRSSSRGPGEIEAGRLLQEIVGRAAAVPAPLTKQLLTLLSDACDERSRAQKLPAAGAQTLPSSAQDAGGLEVAEQDLQWVLTLLASSLTDAGEASLQEDRLLQSSLAQLLSRGPEPRTAAAAAAAVQVGAEAWAAWPGNGQWFRAKVSALHSGGGLAPAWRQRRRRGR